MNDKREEIILSFLVSGKKKSPLGDISSKMVGHQGLEPWTP
jgi:hypothetical protein